MMVLADIPHADNAQPNFCHAPQCRRANGDFQSSVEGV
jgi:hypothetical protein